MLFWPRKRISAPPSRSGGTRVFPRLELLEDRDCPAAPTITTLTAMAMPDGSMLLTGAVLDENLGGVTINFSGAVSATAHTNQFGQFMLMSGGGHLGTVNAQAQDSEGLTSQIAQALVMAPPPPTVTLSVAQMGGRNVMLFGQVTGGASGNLNVSFTGQVTGSALTNSYGAFSYTTVAAGVGAISAQVVDVWGQVGSAQVNVTSNAPTVVMTVVLGANRMVYVTGQVSDETPAGMTVTLSGPISATVTTAANGSFAYSGVASGLGTITATAADVWGLTGSASFAMTNIAPVIGNFQIVSGGINGYWTVEGQVTDEFASGLIVHLTSTITALNNINVTVGSDGWFTYTVQLQEGTTGAISALTTDWWGVGSNTANTSIV